jgi:hypothetical protein
MMSRMKVSGEAPGEEAVHSFISGSLFYRPGPPRYNEAHDSNSFLISMRTGAMIMTGTPAFLVLFSLIARLHAIPPAVEGLVEVAVSCALLLLTRLEGAISCRTEIDTGISAAATLSAPDTHPPDHRPPRMALNHQRSQRSVWRWRLQPRSLIQSFRASLLRPSFLLQSRQTPNQPSSQVLSRAPSLLRRPSHHNATFLIPGPGVSIASG